MSGPVWVRAGGLAIAGAAAHPLGGWWAVALVIGAYLVAMGFYWEARQRADDQAVRAPIRRHLAEVRRQAAGRVWDGQRWQER